MRRIIIRVGVIVFIVISILVILFSTTILPNENNNGFVRKWIRNESIVPNKTYHIDEILSSIAGVIDTTIYFSGKNPKTLLALSENLSYKDTIILNYSIPPEKLVPFHVVADSPYVYWHFSNYKTIVYGMVPGGKLNLAKVDGGVFIKSAQISMGTTVVKGFDSTMTKQVLKKIDLNTGEVLLQADIGEEFNDSTMGMSTDGVLLWNKWNKQLYYIEFFRNRIYCLDSNLNTLFKRQTIDTVETVKMEIMVEEQVDSAKKLSNAKSRILVNKDALIDHHRLYIVSGLRSDNQSMKNFNTHVTMDVYDLKTGVYEGSFILDKIREKGFKSAIVHNDNLIALFDDKVCFYNLPFN